MKILFIADNFPPERNAQASRVFERARYWARWGHEVTVITCAPNFPEGKLFTGYRNRWRQVEQTEGIRVVRVKTFIAPNAGTWLRILDFVSFMPAAFLTGLFERRPDVLVVTSPQFFAALGAAALAIFRRLPFVLELSDLWPDSIVAVGAMKPSLPLRLLEKLELWLYRRADRIVALTNAFKRNLVRRGVPSAKVAVVINGVDLETFAPRGRDHKLAAQWGIAPRHFVVGYIGTHGMAHALTNVLDAAERTTDPDIRYILVGPGAERDNLIAETERRHLQNVIFIPAQPKNRMPEFWSLCDVALVHLRDTPLFETVIPSKIFEAMGMGLPILLACPKGEAAAILSDSGAGLCVPPEDPQALTDAVASLKQNPDLHRSLATHSLRSAPNHTRERQATEYLTVLNSAASPCHSPRSPSPDQRPATSD